MARHPGYPFEPKSTAYVRPGDFWAIPTRRGGWYCCGRVLAVDVQEVATSRSLIVGLLDWCEPDPPTSDRIVGCIVLDYGVVHIKTVRETGGVLLGHRPLDADGGLEVLLGGHAVNDCPVWGYKSIEGVAHDRFGRHFPEQPAGATMRPAPLSHDDVCPKIVGADGTVIEDSP